MNQPLEEIVWPDPDRETFRIRDKSGAEWALRRYARIQREKAANHRLAEAEIARIRWWLEGEDRRLDADAAYFAGLLTAWHATVLADDPRAKTIKLPAGQLWCRAQPDKIEVRDEAAALAAAKAAGYTALVRVREELDKRALAAHLKDTGELLDGVTVTPQPAKFSVHVEEVTDA